MMKTFLKALAGSVAIAFIVAGCTSLAYSQREYDYNYDYGDGTMYDYDNNQQPVYSDNQNYQYQQPAGGVSINLSFNDFYTQLSPYGMWVNMAPYGQVWVANVPNFQPYSTNGYWAYTTYGWTWVSNYQWGWAPFHYGRWGYNNRYGWYWVPGYNWGPAWVAWSSGADMYGWAPLMPGMNFNVNLSVNLFPASYWTFMPSRYMGNNYIGGYYVNRSRNTTIINNVTIINNYGTENNRRYSMGPSANDVQRHTGRSVQPMRISNASDSRSAGVGDNELRVYRPSRNSNTESGRTTVDPAANNNRTSTQPTTRMQSDQPTNNRVGTQPTRTQPDQPANNRSRTPQTVTQPDQPTNNSRAETRPTRTQQPDQSTNNRPTRTQQSQSTTQQNEYRPNPAQPRVTKPAAPQTTKQIEAAKKESTRAQQRSGSTSGGRR